MSRFENRGDVTEFGSLNHTARARQSSAFYQQHLLLSASFNCFIVQYEYLLAISTANYWYNVTQPSTCLRLTVSYGRYGHMVATSTGKFLRNPILLWSSTCYGSWHHSFNDILYQRYRLSDGKFKVLQFPLFHCFIRLLCKPKFSKTHLFDRLSVQLTLTTLLHKLSFRMHARPRARFLILFLCYPALTAVCGNRLVQCFRQANFGWNCYIIFVFEIAFLYLF